MTGTRWTLRIIRKTSEKPPDEVIVESGDLVEFRPDILTYGVDAEDLIGMLGIVTEVVEVGATREYALVLWRDGKLTDTMLSDLALVQRAGAVVY